MPEDNREEDKKYLIVPPLSGDKGRPHVPVSLDVFKSAYIAEGLGIEDLSKRYHLPVEMVKELVEKHGLAELRLEYQREGMKRIQSTQLDQANKLLDLDLDFKKLRLKALEDKLRDFVAYYERHGDFYKRSPATGEILRNTDGIPLQLSIPSVTKEISQIKESVNLSEGIKNLMAQVEDFMFKKKGPEKVDKDEDVIELSANSIIFSKKD